ncbi:PD-(D/E)XK nuclease family protein [Chondromyces apiculatus]|uniref:PD-(D/E)XK endonuclease-like domain-containing protein n=1 Tax=Chondromyces apiculatus DSM 436 TaxID=1192034 RepID=A0A017T9W6_9BACT|nr:PD-(D/E)XK nuclease family protein [Chondromyces apiculatus]EYF05600.1 Hypothetical protein CAP_3148 [Chondromyces apiculatus DSM 436]
MSRTLITSPSAAARLERASAWLRRRRGSERVLILGASIDAANELVCAVAAKRHAAFGWHRLTLGRLAATLAAPALVTRGLVPAGMLALEALCARVIDRLGRRGELGRFEPVADRPGLPRALARTIEEVRLAGLDAASLATTDLDRILAGFEAELEEANLADRALVIELAAERARDPEARHPLLGLPTLMLDLPLSFALERDLLAALVARSSDALATSPAGDAMSERHLDQVFGVPWERLRPPGADEKGAASPSLIRVQERLFHETDEEPSTLADDVRILSAPGESRECVEIARLALKEASRGVPFDTMAVLLRSPEQYRAHLEEALRRAGIPAHFAQGTVRPDPAGRALLALLACAAENLSASRFAEYLSLGQVPDVTADGAPPPALGDSDRWVPPDEELLPETMLRDPFSDLDLDADLDDDAGPKPTRRRGGSGGRHDRDRWLKSGATTVGGAPRGTQPGAPQGTQQGAPQGTQQGAPSGALQDALPNVQQIESAETVEAQGGDAPGDAEEPPVVEGTLRAPRRWEQILVNAAVIGGLDRWRRRLDGYENELKLDLAEVKEERDVDRIERTLSDLDALRRFALPLLADLPRPGHQASWGEWLNRLGALATRALRKPERVLSVLAELTPMVHIGPVDLNEVRIVLAARLTELLQPPPDRREGRIFVAPIEAARGRSFSVVFVPGLAEKLFPQKVMEEPILRDTLRRRIAEARPDAPLATSDDRVARERLALHLAVGAARERLVLSYPRVDMDQSRPRVPSFYGLELLRAAEGRLPGFGELIRRAEQGGGAARIGWPAPARPQDAIDAAEHDLALLETLFHQPEEQTIGTARYLLSVNPHLARALRFRARRWIPAWTTADGLYRPIPEAREALQAHTFAARSFSPTALQHFAACPYRFFLYAVHKLSPREVPEAIEEMNPLQRGSLVHEALYEVLVALRDQGRLPITPGSLDDARAALDRVLDGVAARFKDELAPAIDRVWADGIASVRADLREWLRRAAEDDEWEPVHFELSFGLPIRRSRDRASVEEPVHLDSGVKLRGSIDLVERSRQGAVRATDYKTGRVRTERNAIVAGGETLQPVLYALVLEKVMPPGTEVHSGRLYYCTSAGGFTEVPILLNDKAREAAAEVVGTISNAIDQAALLAIPAEGACTYCDYRPVCGPYEELRVGRIKRRDLEQRRRLELLRRLT